MDPNNQFWLILVLHPGSLIDLVQIWTWGEHFTTVLPIFRLYKFKDATLKVVFKISIFPSKMELTSLLFCKILSYKILNVIHVYI